MNDDNCDVAFFRDTILHIEDKLSLFKLFHKTLKPGGSLFITDYCKGDVPAHSAEFTKYVAQVWPPIQFVLYPFCKKDLSVASCTT